MIRNGYKKKVQTRTRERKVVQSRGILLYIFAMVQNSNYEMNGDPLNKTGLSERERRDGADNGVVVAGSVSGGGNVFSEQVQDMWRSTG